MIVTIFGLGARHLAVSNYVAKLRPVAPVKASAPGNSFGGTITTVAAGTRQLALPSALRWFGPRCSCL
jgi:hypothetical protein